MVWRGLRLQCIGMVRAAAANVVVATGYTTEACSKHACMHAPGQSGVLSVSGGLSCHWGGLTCAVPVRPVLLHCCCSSTGAWTQRSRCSCHRRSCSRQPTWQLRNETAGDSCTKCAASWSTREVWEASCCALCGESSRLREAVDRVSGRTAIRMERITPVPSRVLNRRRSRAVESAATTTL